MQNVSQEYKDSMKASLRNRGYMRVVFDYINVDAQGNAVLTVPAGVSYSDTTAIFKNGTDDKVYASLEDNFIPVDGSVYFFPERSMRYLERGYVSSKLVSDEACVLTITFPEAVSFDTVTFNFGKSFPADITITDDQGNTYNYTEGIDRVWLLEQAFSDITELTITVSRMGNLHSRFRLYSIDFGNGIMFDNSQITDSNLETNMSPINQELPQMNISLTVLNEGHQFDVENPQSVFYQFDTTTEARIYYGYELDSGDIEWLDPILLYCQDWESDETTATVRCCDVLQINQAVYDKGVCGATNLYDLAVSVLTEMGISNYTIDGGLQSITTSNPIPRMLCKEALQLIANASGRVLGLTRDGGVRIGENEYALSVSSNGHLFNGLTNVLNKGGKITYASLETNFIPVDQSVLFVPENSNYLTTGYVSRLVSLANRQFSNTGIFGYSNENSMQLPYTLHTDAGFVDCPVLTLTLSEAKAVGGMEIIFDRVYATKMQIETYLEGTVQEVKLVENDGLTMIVELSDQIVDTIVICFLETSSPNNRVRVNYLNLFPAISYRFNSELDMMNYPKFTRAEQVSEIVIPYHLYKIGASEEELESETIGVENISKVYSFYFSEPCGDYRAVLSAGSGTVSIVESGAYFVRVVFSAAGDKTISIFGKKYIKYEREYRLATGIKGTVLEWENPLIDSDTLGGIAAESLKDYHLITGSYEYETRGNPELDLGDLVIQNNYKGEEMTMRLIGWSLGFNGGFSGSVKTMKTER